MSVFLFQKEVDQSLLQAGLTIPVTMHDKVQETVGTQLSKGQRTNIKIILEGQYYDAILTNVNFSESNANRTVFQIRYSEGSPICQKLKSLFPSTESSSFKGQNAYIEVYSSEDGALEFRVKSDTKQAFLKYIGSEDSLAGYQRSYKLVFFKVFFKRLIEKKNTYWDDITTDFQQYYIERKKAGRVPDYNADAVINNIENSTLTQVYNLILRNPFNAISNHGFILKETENKDRFVLSPDLYSQLSSNDYQSILNLVDQKLELYYSNIDESMNEA